MNVEALRDKSMAELNALAKEAGGDLALAGSIVWSDEDLGWVADWRLAPTGETHRWQVRGVSFDEARRSASQCAGRRRYCRETARRSSGWHKLPHW